MLNSKRYIKVKVVTYLVIPLLSYPVSFFIVLNNGIGKIQGAHITAGYALIEYVKDKLIRIGYFTW